MLPRLTTHAATAAGWRLEKTPTGRTRFVDPEGRRYVKTSPERAVIVLVPVTSGLPEIYLRRPTPPPTLRTLQRRATSVA